MRIVVCDFTSLDGVVQAPGGPDEDRDGSFAHGGWSMPYFDVEVMGAAIGQAMEHTDALLFGRRTYTTMAAAWPERAGDPFADQMNAITKYVASRTLTQADVQWTNTTVLPSADTLEAIRALKARDGGDILMFGSPALVRELVANDLVDEYRLMIEPILLGGGKRLFPDDGTARPLQLVSVEQASTGTVVCVYRPA